MSELTPKMALHTDMADDILRFISQSMQNGKTCVLVTLTDIDGGAPRQIGAHMAVASDGLYCGFVSGGCVEAIVASIALQAIQEHRTDPALIEATAKFGAR